MLLLTFDLRVHCNGCDSVPAVGAALWHSLTSPTGPEMPTCSRSKAKSLLPAPAQLSGLGYYSPPPVVPASRGAGPERLGSGTPGFTLEQEGTTTLWNTIIKDTFPRLPVHPLWSKAL